MVEFSSFNGYGVKDAKVRQYVITPQMYGAKGDGVTDDTQAIKTAIARHSAVFFPRGTYLVSDTLILQNQKISGAGASYTTLVMTAQDVTKPIIRAHRSTVIEDIRLSFAEGLVTGNEAVGERVCILSTTIEEQGYWSLQRGGAIRNVIFSNCGTAVHGDIFSFTFDTLEIEHYSCHGFWLTGGTQNMISNVYFGFNKYSPWDALILDGETGSYMDCINVEHCLFRSSPIIFRNCAGFTVDSMHLEGIGCTANYNSYIAFHKSSGVINDLSVFFTRIQTQGCAIMELGTVGHTFPDNAVAGTDYCRIKINNLNLVGLGMPDWATYPDWPEDKKGLNNAPEFKVAYRKNEWEGTYYLEVDNYNYATFMDDAEIYENFPYTSWKITALKLGTVNTVGTTEARPTKRLVKGRTQYFDTTLGKMVTWNGSNWV